MTCINYQNYFRLYACITFKELTAESTRNPQPATRNRKPATSIPTTQQLLWHYNH